MNVVLTFKVTLLYGRYASDKWEGVFEVDSKSLLEDIHVFMQQTLNFDNDHLYEFYVARTERSRDRISFDDENGGPYDTRIANLYPLPDKKQLYYLFDYGDNWLFKITRTRKAAQESGADVKYPRLVGESGVRPEQYSYDED